MTRSALVLIMRLAFGEDRVPEWRLTSASPPALVLPIGDVVTGIDRDSRRRGARQSAELADSASECDPGHADHGRRTDVLPMMHRLSPPGPADGR